MKIAFFSAKSYEREFFDRENAPFGYEIKYFESPLNEDTCSLAQGYDVVCAFVNDKVSKEVIERLCEYKIGLIALRCAGYNNVDLDTAKDKVTLVRVPIYSPYAVAEHAIALMLCLNRKLHHAFYRTRDNNFSIAGLLGFDMHGKTAGVIGCGEIGSKTVQILKGFGMRVIGYDIDKSQVEQAGCSYADLPALYAQSDIISLHCSLHKENTHLIDKASIAQMKKGVMLINTSRGGLIDHTALIEGLKTQKIDAVGLDVYEEESEFFYKDLSSSFIPDDVLARLQTFSNVLITSHQAFFTEEAMHNIALTTLKNIQAYQEGKSSGNEI